jgi:hypothetical protein
MRTYGSVRGAISDDRPYRDTYGVLEGGTTAPLFRLVTSAAISGLRISCREVAFPSICVLTSGPSN